MKKYSFFFLLFLVLNSCSDQVARNNNPNLPNYTVLIDINLNLPEYSSLKFVSNAVLIPARGVRGVVVFNTGSGYNAFDAACPNQPLSSCSTMTIKGINLLCACDNEEYSLFTGQGKLQYPLKQYRVEVNGTVLRVFN
jgi:nitrite reductase/ring-hydroxylating ferredoxin subunit